MCNEVDLKALREKSNLTLSQLSELVGCSVLEIIRAEDDKKVPVCEKKHILSVLLQIKEDGVRAEVKIWRDRALQAEEKLKMLKAAMAAWMKKI